MEAAMKRMTTVFREMLAAPEIIHAPIAYDPLSARIAQRVGFRCLDLVCYALGASSCVPEPLLSLEEVLIATRRITAAVEIPLMVDGGAGFGDPTHVIRAIRELERAGAAAVHIEDQVYPKRSEEHTSELQSRFDLVCRLLLEKKNMQRHNWYMRRD